MVVHASEDMPRCAEKNEYCIVLIRYSVGRRAVHDYLLAFHGEVMNKEEGRKEGGGENDDEFGDCPVGNRARDDDGDGMGDDQRNMEDEHGTPCAASDDDAF